MPSPCFYAARALFCCEEGGGDAQACLTRPLIKRLSYSNKPAIIRKKIEQIKRKQHILNHRIIQSGRIRYGMFHVFSFLYESPGGITQTRATRYIYVGLAPPSGGQFWVPHPPLRLGILIFTAKRRKKRKKEEKDPLPFLLKDHALHGLSCALPSDPPACPRSGAAAGAGGRVPGVPLACAIPAAVLGQPEPLPIIRAYRAYCAHPHRCPAQRPAGSRKADRQRATESIPAHLGALT